MAEGSLVCTAVSKYSGHFLYKIAIDLYTVCIKIYAAYTGKNGMSTKSCPDSIYLTILSTSKDNLLWKQNERIIHVLPSI